MPLSTTVRLAIGAALTSTQDLGSAKATLPYEFDLPLATGTGAGQADRLFHDQRTLAASATEDLDLAGALTDALGGPFVLARVRAFMVRAADANVNDVIVGGASTPFASWLGAGTHTNKVRPGGVLFLATGAGDAVGYTVTGGSADLLRIGNGGAGTSVTYDIVVIGASA